MMVTKFFFDRSGTKWQNDNKQERQGHTSTQLSQLPIVNNYLEPYSNLIR